MIPVIADECDLGRRRRWSLDENIARERLHVAIGWRIASKYIHARLGGRPEIARRLLGDLGILTNRYCYFIANKSVPPRTNDSRLGFNVVLRVQNQGDGAPANPIDRLDGLKRIVRQST
jgi:hypothetical protein